MTRPNSPAGTRPTARNADRFADVDLERLMRERSRQRPLPPPVPLHKMAAARAGRLAPATAGLSTALDLVAERFRAADIDGADAC